MKETSGVKDISTAKDKKFCSDKKNLARYAKSHDGVIKAFARYPEIFDKTLETPGLFRNSQSQLAGLKYNIRLSYKNHFLKLQFDLYPTQKANWFINSLGGTTVRNTNND